MIWTRRYLMSLTCLLAMSALTWGQDHTGAWHGLLIADDSTIRITANVTMTDGNCSVSLDSPDQGAYDIPMDSCAFEDGRFTFGFSRARMTYEGQINLVLSTVTGTYRQGSEQFTLNFSREEIPPPEGSPLWAAQSVTKKEHRIPMRDGVNLFASVYSPKDLQAEYPILLWRTPYNSEPNGEERFNNRIGRMGRYLEAGYHIVFQDVRGRYMSEGEFVNVRPYNPDKQSPKDIDETSDTWDTIDWLVKNVPNNNGRVGIFGISYPGFYATMSLPESHPALKAASPQAPVLNWFIGDDWHHNGAFLLMDAFSFFSRVGYPRPEPTRQDPPPFQWSNQDNYEFFLALGPVKNAREKYLPAIEFWPDLMAHPNYDDWWKARDPSPHLRNVQPAVLTVGGWFDAEDLYGPLQTYEVIEKQSPPSADNRILMGPWFHGQWHAEPADRMGNVHWGSETGRYYQDLELQFFEHYLKDKPAPDLAEATMFDTGSNTWRQFDQWPPEKSVDQTLFFTAGGGLSFDSPDDQEFFEEYVADPDNPVPYTEDVHLRRTREYMSDDQRFASRRPDVVVYESEPLSSSITLSGPIVANLFVSTTGTDADYVVKIVDVFPDTLANYPDNEKNVPMQGYQMLVRGEVLRGKYRNSFEEPEPFVPGKVTRVSFEIPDVMHTFKPGHRIMVQVQNSWFPLVDRNPQSFVNIYEADAADFQKATHRLYSDRERPSGLRVKVLGGHTATLPGGQTDPGFTSLFNGSDLAGWTGAIDGYAVEDGLLVCRKDGGGNLYIDRPFSDFVFRFEFKLAEGGNNGVGIRAQKGADAAYDGMEIQILDDTADEYAGLNPYQYHGSVYGVVPAEKGHQKPIGEWNTEEIRAEGSRITITLNGHVIVDADLREAAPDGKTVDGREHPGLFNESGYIGFLGHGHRVEFRNLRIKEL